MWARVFSPLARDIQGQVGGTGKTDPAMGSSLFWEASFSLWPQELPLLLRDAGNQGVVGQGGT